MIEYHRGPGGTSDHRIEHRVGLLGTALGGIILTYLVVYKIAGGEIMTQHGPLMVAGGPLLVAGLMMFTTGLLGEVMIRTYFESQGRAEGFFRAASEPTMWLRHSCLPHRGGTRLDAIGFPAALRTISTCPIPAAVSRMCTPHPTTRRTGFWPDRGDILPGRVLQSLGPRGARASGPAGAETSPSRRGG